MKRNKTRRQRYEEKIKNSTCLPISVATINFSFDVNVAYIIRAAACFGIEAVHVIGKLPERKILNELSGSTYDYIKVFSYSSVHEFLEFIENNNINLIAAEVPSECPYKIANSIYDYSFDFNHRQCIIIGNESYGIPIEISLKSNIVYVPMNGVGFCLNAAQTANIILYESARQYNEIKIL